MNQCYIEAFKAERPLIPDKNFDIKQFGALGDGIKLNTYEINQAIEACEAEGGGKVIIPQGIWLTGPIRLRSNVNLHLEEGALVLFSSNMDDYPLIQSSFEGLQAVRCQSPLDGEGLENIAVTGKGVFDGGGEAWRPVKKFNR
jgi:polygalacturonase